jgi:hypothetical protein
MIVYYKKSQSAIEFLGLTMAIIFLFTLLFVSINENMGDKISEKNNEGLKEIAYIIQDEINLAQKSTDGYNRVFRVPLDINGQDYSVDIAGEMIIAKTSDNRHAISLPVPIISGNIIKGNNYIKKEYGNITLNP